MNCKKCGALNNEKNKRCVSCDELLHDEKTLIDKYYELEQETDTTINKIIYTLLAVVAIFMGIDFVFYLLMLLIHSITNLYPAILDYIKYIFIIAAEVYYFRRKYRKKVKKK